MPIYHYNCNNCKNYFDAKHSVGEFTEECLICGKVGMLIRVPSIPLSFKKKFDEVKPGDLVKKFIEESREDLTQQKEEMEHQK